MPDSIPAIDIFVEWTGVLYLKVFLTPPNRSVIFILYITSDGTVLAFEEIDVELMLTLPWVGFGATKNVGGQLE